MRPHGHKPSYIVSLLGLALMSVAYESTLSPTRTVEASSQTGQGPGPIPPDGPLARPKSLQQIGMPVEATRAAAPADNPQTPEKIALGEKLFFDGRLSVDGTVACSTCHDPARAFTDGRPVSIGVKGREGQRNSLTILNALYNVAQFWDGRAKTLEEQAALPIINPSEMGQPNMDAAVARVAAVPEYEQGFRRVFGHAPNATDLVRAIAAYERTQFSFDSPFDRFIAGDKNAISESALRGWNMFSSKARCNKCHALTEQTRDPVFFMDKDFHNIGIGILRHNVVAEACQAEQELNSGNTIDVDRAAIQSDMSVLGRFLVTKKDSDIASFKTPSLRNVLITAPYFHDGSQATLWDVMDHYNKGDGIKDPWLDEDMQPLALSESEIDDVVAFMASLTSVQYKEAGMKELERQRSLSRTSRAQRDTARAFGPKPVQPKPIRNCAELVPRAPGDRCHRD
jgi:cytochrome c peroxidase